MYVYVPNPLFQTLSTTAVTAVIFFYLHKAPAQFRGATNIIPKLHPRHYKTSTATSELAAKTIRQSPDSCGLSLVLRYPKCACIYTALQYYDVIGTKKFDQLSSRIRLTCFSVYLVSFCQRTAIYRGGPRRLVHQPFCTCKGCEPAGQPFKTCHSMSPSPYG